MASLAAAAMAAAALVSVTGPAAATAAPAAAPVTAASTALAQPKPPKRADKKNRTVLFIHGFQAGQKANCSEIWGKTKAHFRAKGWTGALLTWGYYKKNTGCDYGFQGTTSTDLAHVATALGQFIYRYYSSKGKTVDIVTHSTGGLLIRNAITLSRTDPSRLGGKIYVEDVVTLAGPHEGSAFAHFCAALQCVQLRPRSAYINAINSLSNRGKHIADGGTNWTMVGSFYDTTVTAQSATSGAFVAHHRFRYLKGEKVAHSTYYKTGTGTSWSYSYSSGGAYRDVVNGGSGPIRLAYMGSYYHKAF